MIHCHSKSPFCVKLYDAHILTLSTQQRMCGVHTETHEQCGAPDELSPVAIERERERDLMRKERKSKTNAPVCKYLSCKYKHS